MATPPRAGATTPQVPAASFLIHPRTSRTGHCLLHVHVNKLPGNMYRFSIILSPCVFHLPTYRHATAHAVSYQETRLRIHPDRLDPRAGDPEMSRCREARRSDITHAVRQRPGARCLKVKAGD